MSNHYIKKIKVRNRDGIHARPSVKVVELANEFSSDIYIVKDDLRVNGKSILEVLTLAASYGTELTVEAVGDDAEEAANEVGVMLSTEFEFPHQDTSTSE
ncbi:MAG: HPr family phosphocarrier protein [Spirochaetota bacterium]|nr:HPr family phosphocarrier protein [Spirochaetota bacterium]